MSRRQIHLVGVPFHVLWKYQQLLFSCCFHFLSDSAPFLCCSENLDYSKLLCQKLILHAFYCNGNKSLEVDKNPCIDNSANAMRKKSQKSSLWSFKLFHLVTCWALSDHISSSSGHSQALYGDEEKLPGRKKPQGRHFKKRSPLLGWLGVVRDLQVEKKKVDQRRIYTHLPLKGKQGDKGQFRGQN